MLKPVLPWLAGEPCEDEPSVDNARMRLDRAIDFLERGGDVATYAAPLPRYVVNAFERYLACGDFSVLLLLAFVGSGITAAPRPASGTARPAG